MRPVLVALLLAFGLAACDSSAPDGALGGVYSHTYAEAEATVTVTLDVPPVSDGAFQLGDDSRVRATMGDEVADVGIEGEGTVTGGRVSLTINEYPSINTARGELYLALDGGEPLVLTGALSADGRVMTFEDGDDVARFER